MHVKFVFYNSHLFNPMFHVLHYNFPLFQYFPLKKHVTIYMEKPYPMVLWHFILQLFAVFFCFNLSIVCTPVSLAFYVLFCCEVYLLFYVV